MEKVSPKKESLYIGNRSTDLQKLPMLVSALVVLVHCFGFDGIHFVFAHKSSCITYTPLNLNSLLHEWLTLWLFLHREHAISRPTYLKHATSLVLSFLLIH